MKLVFIILFPLLFLKNDCSKTTRYIDKEYLLNLVNTIRAEGCMCGDTLYAPAAPLVWNAQLEEAAQRHSDFMNNSGEFSHRESDSSTPCDRIKRAGYVPCVAGENIAHWLLGDETYAVQQWVRSPGHCKNIMDPRFTEMAIARSGLYWTQEFASK